MRGENELNCALFLTVFAYPPLGAKSKHPDAVQVHNIYNLSDVSTVPICIDREKRTLHTNRVPFIQEWGPVYIAAQ